MLNPNYSYLAFDFETTGLDTVKDEPIQIGLVLFDHEFTVLKSFSSLIKPKKNIKELRSIVSHLTGFALADLEDAPSMEELLPQLAPFFSDTTVIVGHNISFDLAFIQRYMTFEPVHQIDTFVLAKALYHFLPSYALDILNEHLRKNNEHHDSGEDDYHDALHDSYLGLNLFHQCMKKLTKLRRGYLILDYMFQNSSSMMSDIIKRTPKPYAFENKELFFPPLVQKSLQDNKKIISETPLHFDDYENKAHLDISLSSIKEIVNNTNWKTGKRVLAFTHPSKVQIVEAAFKKMHISTSSGHDSISFDPERVNAYLHKASFDDEELLFTLKYYSQFDQKHSYLDINSQGDYKIFAALSNAKKKKQANITLCTHQQLLTRTTNTYDDTTVLFFDKDWWQQSYSRVKNQQFDPMYLINHLEQIQYKYGLIKHESLDLVKDFLQKTLFLHSGLCIEINPFFTGGDIPRVAFTDIVHDTRFPKTSSLYPSREGMVKELETKLLEEDASVMAMIHRFINFLTQDTTVSKRMYAGSKRYYQFAATQTYVDRSEFMHDLPDTKRTFFLSNKKRMHHDTRIQHQLSSDTVEALHFLNIKTDTDSNSIIQAVQKNTTNCFIVSSDKSKSKKLFEAMVKQGLNKDYEILGENITGGVGKNLQRGRISSKPLVFIGGYNFYLATQAKGISIDTAYLYHLHGKLAAQIVNDIMWWRVK